MTKLITCTVTAPLATIAISFVADNDKEAIMSREKAAWQASKDKKPDDFKKLLSTDLVTVYAAAGTAATTGALTSQMRVLF